MTHEELEIDTETFAASLRVIGHPWCAGQQCEGTPAHNEPFALRPVMEHCRLCDAEVSVRPFRLHLPSHDIPIPAVTDELLMRMLREGLKRNRDFLDTLVKWLFYVDGRDLEAAIIRATAALDEK